MAIVAKANAITKISFISFTEFLMDIALRYHGFTPSATHTPVALIRQIQQ